MRDLLLKNQVKKYDHEQIQEKPDENQDEESKNPEEQKVKEVSEPVFISSSENEKKKEEKKDQMKLFSPDASSMMKPDHKLSKSSEFSLVFGQSISDSSSDVDSSASNSEIISPDKHKKSQFKPVFEEEMKDYNSNEQKLLIKSKRKNRSTLSMKAKASNIILKQASILKYQTYAIGAICEDDKRSSQKIEVECKKRAKSIQDEILSKLSEQAVNLLPKIP